MCRKTAARRWLKTDVRPKTDDKQPDGVWGIAGYVKPDMPVHYCVDGRTICTDRHQTHRRLRLPLPHWNIDSPRTCPRCRELVLVMREAEQGKAKT